MIKVKCPYCGNGDAEVTEVEQTLDYICIKCEQCKKEYVCGIRDWEIDN